MLQSGSPHDLSRAATFHDASASVGRHSSCRETVPVRLRRHPRRYFPSFDRKHPITPVIPCNIVQHHGQPPRVSVRSIRPCARNSSCNDRKIVKFLDTVPCQTFPFRLVLSRRFCASFSLLFLFVDVDRFDKSSHSSPRDRYHRSRCCVHRNREFRLRTLPSPVFLCPLFGLSFLFFFFSVFFFFFFFFFLFPPNEKRK